ncbi:MAG: phosphorylase family protein, partial [Planctomycetota bacterium]
LDWSTRPGGLVHCTRAVQADLALRSEREVEPDAARTAALAAACSRPAWFLTADRPALSPWRRLRLARAYGQGSGPIADMETAAVAWVARRAGLPWSALRAVSDGLGLGPKASFRANFKAQAGRAAEVVRALAEGR